MFEHIKAAPADPILGLGEAFKSETRENKINLGIGVYKDAQGTTPIMRAVKEAEVVQVHYVLLRSSSNAKPKHKMYGLVRQHGQTIMRFSMRWA